MVKRFGAKTMMAMAATVLIWSTTFAAMSSALKGFTPDHLLFLRWWLTAAVFIAVGVITRIRLPRAADLPRIAAAGLLGFALYQGLLVHGQAGVSATMAGFLINMNPAFTTVIAVALGREKASWATWTGLALCSAGLFVMAQGRGGITDGLGSAALLVVAAALSFALYTLVSKPLLARYSPLEVTTYCLVAGVAPFVLFAPGSLDALRAADLRSLVDLVYLALLPGGLAYVLWTHAVKGLPVGLASRFLYLIPVLGMPVAWVWVGEVPGWATVVGGLVTLAGVALAAARITVRTPVRPHAIEVRVEQRTEPGSVLAETA